MKEALTRAYDYDDKMLNLSLSLYETGNIKFHVTKRKNHPGHRTGCRR